MDWIPITNSESYPEVEMLVLVAVIFSAKRRGVLRARWIGHHTTEASDFEGELDYDEATDCYYWPEGWYEWNEFDETNWGISGTVTHWMPLPKYPVE